MGTSAVTNPDLFFVFLALLGPGMLRCSGADPLHPLLQESIVPERDLPPRNFNPHPYVSAAAAVLSNFDHPYPGVASKRLGYFRNGPNAGVHQQLDNDPVGRSSINSLADFARRFLGLDYNGMKSKIIKTERFSSSPLKFPSTKNNDPLDYDRVGGYRIIDYPNSQNGPNNRLQLLVQPTFAIGNEDEDEDQDEDEDEDDGDVYDGNDGDGDEGRIRQLPASRAKDQLRDQSFYLRNTLNLASVQQSSLNEDALSLGDTNDNLSQGFYVGNDEEGDRSFDALNYLGQDQYWMVTEAPRRGIESYNKPLYFITSNSNYRNSINEELHLDPNRNTLYLSV